MARNKETKLTSLSQAAVNFSTIDGCIARVTEKAVGKKKRAKHCESKNGTKKGKRNTRRPAQRTKTKMKEGKNGNLISEN